MKKIVVTVGPIPGKLDSVKYITNRFKGGLAAKTANVLSKNNEVVVVKWHGTDVKLAEGISVVNVEDVYEYVKVVPEITADAYVLAAAVANLVPLKPWEGKFPSHNYQVGDSFDIAFTIAPRLIDIIKQRHPTATLIGYKLFDGTKDELINAGWHTLVDSKANVVFCNFPDKAKDTKYAVMPSGSVLEMTFDDHVAFIERVINLEWYSTLIAQYANQRLDRVPVEKIELAKSLLQTVKCEWNGYNFGSVAIRHEEGFITTTRGKRGEGLCYVSCVDHGTRTIYASDKATLNAPVLDGILRLSKKDIVLHGHAPMATDYTLPYLFPGTTEENVVATLVSFNVSLTVKEHGWYKVV